MITILTKGYPGRILVCAGCGSLLSYQESDIYGANLIYCPVCKYCNTIDYDKNFNGIIKNN